MPTRRETPTGNATGSNPGPSPRATPATEDAFAGTTSMGSRIRGKPKKGSKYSGDT